MCLRTNDRNLACLMSSKVTNHIMIIYLTCQLESYFSPEDMIFWCGVSNEQILDWHQHLSKEYILHIFSFSHYNHQPSKVHIIPSWTLQE